jgi:hypothetical protein
MDDELDPEIIRQRAFRALEDTADIEERIAARQAANGARRLLGESRRPAPEPPAPVPPVQRPQGPRNWDAEGVWIRQHATEIADQKLAVFREELAAGVGLVIREERAATKVALEALRTSFTREIANVVTDVHRAIDAAGHAEGANLRQIAQGIAQIQQMLQRLDFSNAALARSDARLAN